MYGSTLIDEKFKEVNAQIERIKDKYDVLLNFKQGNKAIYEYDLTYTDEWKEAPENAGVYKPIKEYHKNGGRSIITKLPKGYALDKHNHLDKEVIYCLNGIFRININGETIDLTENQSIFIEPFIYHDVEVIEDCELLVTWYKNEEDY